MFCEFERRYHLSCSVQHFFLKRVFILFFNINYCSDSLARSTAILPLCVGRIFNALIFITWPFYTSSILFLTALTSAAVSFIPEVVGCCSSTVSTDLDAG